MNRRTWVVVAFLLLLVAGIYGRTAGFGFIEQYDDQRYLLANPHVRAGLSVAGTAWAFTSLGYASNWHPLTWLSHMLDVQLFGLNAGAHHVVNAALHAANAVLLLIALRGMTGALWPSAFVAAAFAAHPLHVESVAWVAERKDVLSTLFWSITVLAWLRYVRRPGPARYGAAAGALALGLMAKPMLVTLPPLLLVLDVWPLGRLRPEGGRAGPTLARLAAEKLPLLLLSAASSVIAVLAQQRGAGLTTLSYVSVANRLANALSAYVAYLRLTLWPAGLSFLTTYERIPLWTWRTAGAAIVLAALTAVVLRGWRRSPWLAAGWLWYLGTLLPVIGFIQAGEQAVADRYTYVPVTGLFIALAWEVGARRERWRVSNPMLVAVAAGTISALSALAFVQAGFWRDDVTLFQRGLALNPRNWVAGNNLGIALAKRGLEDEAYERFAHAVEAQPHYIEARHNLAVSLYNRGRLDEAAAQCRTVLQFRPDFAAAHDLLGVILDRQGDLDGAIARFREAMRLDPGDALARKDLEDALRKRNARGGR